MVHGLEVQRFNRSEVQEFRRCCSFQPLNRERGTRNPASRFGHSKIQGFSFILLMMCMFSCGGVRAGVNIVTSIEDLAAIAREIGGGDADVVSLARGYQDPHFVEAKPSFLLKLKKADLFIQAGLELEVAWAPALLINARNRKILPGNPGFLDASQGCEILQKPSARVDRGSGDVHPFGNPHFWLDPENGRAIARAIAKRLAETDPSRSKNYYVRLSDFESRLTKKEKEWESLAGIIKGRKAVTYHNSWPNFAKRFGIEIVNFVEPRPGIPPSPSHIQSLVAQIKAEKIPLLLVEPYFDSKLPGKIAQETGARLLTLLPSTGAEKNVTTYFDLFDYDLELIKNALSEGDGK